MLYTFKKINLFFNIIYPDYTLFSTPPISSPTPPSRSTPFCFSLVKASKSYQSNMTKYILIRLNKNAHIATIYVHKQLACSYLTIKI